MGPSRKRIALTLAIILVISAYPISLLSRELWQLSDVSGVAISSALLGAGVGIILVSVLIPGSKKVDSKPKMDSDSEVFADA